MENVYKYVLKEDSRALVNFALPIKRLEKEKEKTSKEIDLELVNLTIEKGYEVALKYLIENYPEKLAKSYCSYERNLKKLELELEREKERLETFELSSYNLPEELLDWFKNKRYTHTLILYGASGVGKTQAALTLLKNTNPLLLTHLEGLKNLKKKNTSIIFDDVNLENLSDQEKIHLFDRTMKGEIRILYGTIIIPKNTIMIFTTNNLKTIYSEFLLEKDVLSAIERRIVEVREKMYIENITINITNSSIDNSTNIDNSIDNSTTNNSTKIDNLEVNKSKHDLKEKEARKEKEDSDSTDWANVGWGNDEWEIIDEKSESWDW